MPSIAPSLPNDIDVYLVLDDFGERGRSWREVDEGRTDREAVITDLLEGQYSAPATIVAFNIAEGWWSRDVSEEIAGDLADRLAIDGREATPSLAGFLERHAPVWPVQLPLPLRGVA